MVLSVRWVLAGLLLATSSLSGETETGLCSYKPHSNTLHCSNLTRLSLVTGGQTSLTDLRHLEIVSSKIQCLRLSSLAKYSHLRLIKVVWSDLRALSCHSHRVRHRKDIHQFRYLTELDVSHNWLESVDSVITVLRQLEIINMSHNNLSQISLSFSAFPRLRELDLSHNRLMTVSPRVLTGLSPMLELLDLTNNPWRCVSSLSWLYRWSSSVPGSVKSQLESPDLTCHIENSRQTAPLFPVVSVYSTLVLPACHELCDCQFYHFALTKHSSPAYTVIVNCSATNLTTFPSLPAHTVVLDLSHNNINNQAFNQLDIEKHNYNEVASIILSYNNLTSIDSKLLSLKPHRGFHVDHNRISVISYELSQLLQSFKSTEISLGHNQWRCECEAEITDTNLLSRLADVESLRCSADSRPEKLTGLKVSSLVQGDLCPPSYTEEIREVTLQTVCLVLACLNLAIFSKLLYDYWQYKQRGKLPSIVHLIPFL